MNLHIVDAFTDRPFAGNPAAVCVLNEPADDTWMQQVAREMNQAETAFLLKEADGYRLRWFSPRVEVDLCGHATLASAHLLWEKGYAPQDAELRFHTRSGLLTAARSGDWITLNFPLEPAEPCEAPELLTEALGVPLRFVGKNRFDYIVEVESEETVRALCPKFDKLAMLPSRGVIVTSSCATGEYDFISRFFCPALGVPEDPVTGSAHSCLGPYWQSKLNKDRLYAYQASERGGVLKLQIQGGRILISGQAVTVLEGKLR